MMPSYVKRLKGASELKKFLDDTARPVIGNNAIADGMRSPASLSPCSSRPLRP
jgi:hypothetical protein